MPACFQVCWGCSVCCLVFLHCGLNFCFEFCFGFGFFFFGKMKGKEEKKFFEEKKKASG
eukprot:m.144205 g.144205  ORF g.144205 m.144205 type:complete len:59 (+) comp20455_c0_seq2:1412-1588(+)